MNLPMILLISCLESILRMEKIHSWICKIKRGYKLTCNVADAGVYGIGGTLLNSVKVLCGAGSLVRVGLRQRCEGSP